MTDYLMIPDTTPWYEGLAVEDIRTGDRVMFDLRTGRVKRYEIPPAPPQPQRKIRFVRRHGNMYLPKRYPLGTKFYYDVFDWGHAPELYMHLFVHETSRSYFRRTGAKGRVPIYSGRIAFKKELR